MNKATKKVAKKAAKKPEKLVVEVGGVYLNGYGNRVEIVGKMRRTDLPFVGIVRCPNGYYTDTYNRKGQYVDGDSEAIGNLAKRIK